MIINNEFLINYRKIIKLYEFMLKDLQTKYNLSKIEVDIISFLHNNPSKNTARDIVEFRLLQKGNVSFALNSLVENNLLIKQLNINDARKTSLFLTDNSKDITDEIDKINKSFQKQIFEGFNKDDIKTYFLFNKMILNNINDIERTEFIGE